MPERYVSEVNLTFSDNHIIISGLEHISKERMTSETNLGIFNTLARTYRVITLSHFRNMFKTATVYAHQCGVSCYKDVTLCWFFLKSMRGANKSWFYVDTLYVYPFTLKTCTRTFALPLFNTLVRGLCAHVRRKTKAKMLFLCDFIPRMGMLWSLSVMAWNRLKSEYWVVNGNLDEVHIIILNCFFCFIQQFV